MKIEKTTYQCDNCGRETRIGGNFQKVTTEYFRGDEREYNVIVLQVFRHEEGEEAETSRPDLCPCCAADILQQASRQALKEDE